MASAYEAALPPPPSLRARFAACLLGVLGYIVLAACGAYAICLLSWSAADASLFHSSSEPTRNLLGPFGAIFADLIIYLLGLTGALMILPPMFWALQLTTLGKLERARLKIALAPAAIVLLSAALASVPTTQSWPLSYGYGGLVGDQVLNLFGGLLAMLRPERAAAAAGLFCLAGGLVLLSKSLGLSQRDLRVVFRRATGDRLKRALRRWDLYIRSGNRERVAARREPTLRMPGMGGPARSAHAMEPSFAAQAHRQTPPVDGFAYARRGPAFPPEPTLDGTSDIARRFAPARREVDPAASEADAVDEPPPAWHGDGYDAHARGAEPSPRQPMPRSSAHADWPSMHPQYPEPAFEDLYGRAVAIVLRDRKASSDHLRGCLHIGYMRASDLIERMEKEGVVGAPLYNGVRPILIGGSGSGEI